MMIAIPEYCERCGEKVNPENIDWTFWPFEQVMNGTAYWLCKDCQKDMQKVLRKWMKEHKEKDNMEWGLEEVNILVKRALKIGYQKGYRAGREYAMIRTRKMVKNWVPTTYSPEQMRKMEIEEGEK